MPFDDTTPRETREELRVLDKMRELLAQPGRWCQGQFTQARADGPAYCLLGAFNVALGRHATHDEWHDGEMALIRSTFGFGPLSIENFNDSNLTTHDDVLKLLDMTRENLTKGE